MDAPNDPSAPPAQPPATAPDRNLAMELVRVTEAAAMAAGRWVGKGQKESADQAAVDAMRRMLDTVAKAKGIRSEEVSVVVLDRDRHQRMIADLRESRAQVMLITDGDVAPSVAAAWGGTGVDLLMGIGGTPEGVISAAALKCLGGGMQGKLWPRTDDERQQLVDAGYDIDEVLDTDRLVGGQDVFVAATGVTTG